MSIGLKLYVLLFLLMVICLSLFTVLNITNQKQNLLDLVELNALRTTDLIKNSIHYSMLINRKEDIEQIFKNFESIEEFEAIRIYDKSGTVIFTTLPKEEGTQTTIKSEACQVCHFASQPLKALLSKQRSRISATSDGQPVLALINPIENEPNCSREGCHVPVQQQAILGVLDVQMSLDIINADLAQNQRHTIIASAVFIVVILLSVGIVIYKQIRNPLKKLRNGTIAIAMGDLDYKIECNRKDEIGELSISFNKMVRELKKARFELTRWSETLQEKVKNKTEELQKIQNHLLHVEKMASLGKLAATVAHELNNPLESILTYTRLSHLRLNKSDLNHEKIKDIIEDLKIVDGETIHCGNIVKNLLLFSKNNIGEHSQLEIKQILNHCLQIINHHLAINNIKLIKNFPEDPIVTYGNSDQIQQAIVAIMINAIEAMDQDGILEVTVILEKGMINISIKDNGCGIAPDKIQYIFEPFYSEKGGKGVGLGSSVAYGIIKAHNGDIMINSKLGEGSEFIIILPLKTEKDYDDSLHYKINDEKGV